MMMGGQRRTIVAPCGWTAKGSIREANFKMKLHVKNCKTCDVKNITIPDFDTKANGLDGITTSKRGNAIKQISHKDMCSTLAIGKTMINRVPVEDAEIVKELLNTLTKQ